MRVAGARARPPRPPPPPLSPVIAAHALDRGREAEGGRAVAAKPTLTFFFAARCAPTCSPSCASSPATCANPIAAYRRKTWPRSGRGPGSSSTARRRSPSSTTCTPSSPRTMSPRGTWRIWRCGAPRWRGTCTCRRREFFFFLGGGGQKKNAKRKIDPFPSSPSAPQLCQHQPAAGLARGGSDLPAATARRRPRPARRRGGRPAGAGAQKGAEESGRHGQGVGRRRKGGERGVGGGRQRVCALARARAPRPASGRARAPRRASTGGMERADRHGLPPPLDGAPTFPNQTPSPPPPLPRPSASPTPTPCPSTSPKTWWPTCTPPGG